jgi:hypothetical protein
MLLALMLVGCTGQSVRQCHIEERIDSNQADPNVDLGPDSNRGLAAPNPNGKWIVDYNVTCSELHFAGLMRASRDPGAPSDFFDPMNP